MEFIHPSLFFQQNTTENSFFFKVKKVERKRQICSVAQDPSNDTIVDSLSILLHCISQIYNKEASNLDMPDKEQKQKKKVPPKSLFFQAKG